MTLTEFLLARIAEDEAAIRKVFVTDPAHLLVECEAKRRIVDLHRLVEPDGVPGCDECGGWTHEYGWTRDGLCDTLRLLALPYADHPDYRDEWKPTGQHDADAAFVAAARTDAGEIGAMADSSEISDPYDEGYIDGARHAVLPTEMIAKAVWSGMPLESVCHIWVVTRPQVLGACWYEARYGRKRWARRWGAWADVNRSAMWVGDWGAVTAPPTGETRQ